MKCKLKNIIISLCTVIFVYLPVCYPQGFDLPNWLKPNQAINTFDVIASQFRCSSFFNQPLVLKREQWYLRNPAYLKVLSQNARPYLYYVFQQTVKRQMPPVIALLPMIESNYNPFLYSSQGATGIWQLMPGTATGLGVPINWWYDGRRDIIQSTNTALDYLQYLHHYLHNWLLAIAAYNSGAGTIQHAVRYNRRHGLPTDYWHLALPAETKIYVPKLLALAKILSSPQFKTLFYNIPYQRYLTPVTLSGQYNISSIAHLCHISADELRFYNPGFRRFSTGPMTNHPILIPQARLSFFLSHSAHFNPSQHIMWQHHYVIPGDTLIGLAHRYHTKAAIIKKVNHLQQDILHPHQSLLIPETKQDEHLSKIDQDADIAENHITTPKSHSRGREQ